MHTLPLDEFLAMLRLQCLIDQRKWKDANAACAELERLQKLSAPPPLNYHQDRPIREVMK
jgi:hypothetical protein